jgi:hypothetical protein
MSAVWHQIDSIGPPLSPSTCDSCKAQQVALETRRTHDFLTRLRDEFEQLQAHLVFREPCVSLMEALAAVRNEELRLHNTGLLQSSSSSVLAARSSSLRLLPLHMWCLLQQRLLLREEGMVVFIVTIVVRRLIWRHIATRRRRLSLAEVVVVVLHRVQVVLVVLIQEALSGVPRHRRCSCCFIA